MKRTLCPITRIVLLIIIQLSLARGQSLFRSSFDIPEPSFETRPSSFFNNNNDNNNNNSTSGASSSSASSLVWQPLRATFRPLNRQSQPPQPPQPPSPPAVPQPPESLALVSEPEASAATSSFFSDSFSQPTITTTTTTTTTTTSTTTTPSPTIILNSNLDDEDLPTRVPSGSFRPTRPPSVESTGNSGSQLINFPANSRSQNSSSSLLTNVNVNVNTAYRITHECFECICEASTSCNVNSRCQTSDVRHTRCGMFLISYDQWLSTGLSKQLVTREALARDAAADERAFYECVTDRDCAERLLSIYMQKNVKDCDRDGRIDCYDVASIHQGGTDQCNSESLLDSQYWNDFNACFGFGR